MVMKPSNWDLPRRCEKISYVYDGKEYKQTTCLHENCPIGKWLPPKKVFDTTSKFLKFKLLVGKCTLIVSQDETVNESDKKE